MAKKKLLEDIKANPGRFYRLPGDVVRDRRFDDGERLEILRAWAGEARCRARRRSNSHRGYREPPGAPDHAAE